MRSSSATPGSPPRSCPPTTKWTPCAIIFIRNCWRSCSRIPPSSPPPFTSCLSRATSSASPITPPTSPRTSSSWCAASTSATTPPKTSFSRASLRLRHLHGNHPLQHAPRRPELSLGRDPHQRALLQIHHHGRLQQQSYQASQMRLVTRQQDLLHLVVAADLFPYQFRTGARKQIPRFYHALAAQDLRRDLRGLLSSPQRARKYQIGRSLRAARDFQHGSQVLLALRGELPVAVRPAGFSPFGFSMAQNIDFHKIGRAHV